MPTAKKKIKKPEAKVPEKKQDRYFAATGRRKTAIARVRIVTKRGADFTKEEESSLMEDKDFIINGKQINIYFPALELQQIAKASLDKMNCSSKFTISVMVNGGGSHSQAEAIRHGVSRALVIFNADFRKRLKKSGFLTRDPRMRERKKFGLKRARRAPQWQKR